MSKKALHELIRAMSNAGLQTTAFMGMIDALEKEVRDPLILLLRHQTHKNHVYAPRRDGCNGCIETSKILVAEDKRISRRNNS